MQKEQAIVALPQLDKRRYKHFLSCMPCCITRQLHILKCSYKRQGLAWLIWWLNNVKYVLKCMLAAEVLILINKYDNSKHHWEISCNEKNYAKLPMVCVARKQLLGLLYCCKKYQLPFAYFFSCWILFKGDLLWPSSGFKELLIWNKAVDSKNCSYDTKQWIQRTAHMIQSSGFKELLIWYKAVDSKSCWYDTKS